MTENLSLPTEGGRLIADEVSAYGRRGLETGGFLMLPTEGDAVTELAFAGERGIVREPYLFQISERALDRLFTYADDQGLWIPIQFHSHGLGARMSPTDARHGLRGEGFISTIVPRFVSPPSDPSQWGWWRFQDGEWLGCPLVGTAASAIRRVVVFDEDGVRER